MMFPHKMYSNGLRIFEHPFNEQSQCLEWTIWEIFVIQTLRYSNLRKEVGIPGVLLSGPDTNELRFLPNVRTFLEMFSVGNRYFSN